MGLNRRMRIIAGLLLVLVLGAGAGAQECGETVLDAVDSDRELTYFSKALRETSLDASLDGPGPYVVLAPLDSAFESITDGALLESSLKELIRGHILLQGSKEYLGLRPGDDVDFETLCGSDCAEVNVRIEGGQTLLNGGEARALETIRTCNGALVVIDGLLSPGAPAGDDDDDDDAGDYRDYDYSGDDYSGDDYSGDACECTPDGMSGGANTGKSGCFELNKDILVSMAKSFGRRIGEAVSQLEDNKKSDSYGYADFFGKYWEKEALEWASENAARSKKTRSVCYVLDPRWCSDARSSAVHEGAGWRPC
mmetsp:Transcript_35109/g.76111  ORF Transcript_35109/g.76111 Transcript_35109/m.76111 type:complete len:310 (+) Transcript_35109:110-1039(+)